DIPVSLTLNDIAGNTSATYVDPISQTGDAIDANLPVISSVSIPDVEMKVSDTVTVTLTVDDDGGDTYSNLSGTIDGFALSNLSRTNNTTYTAEFTVTHGGIDVAAIDDIPVSLTLDDSAGNSSAIYDAAISQDGDMIDANLTVVVFDLVEGMSSDDGQNKFSVDDDYLIYIRVPSDPDVALSAGEAAWNIWSGGGTLSEYSQIVLVGDAAGGILAADGDPVGAATTTAKATTAVTGTAIRWSETPEGGGDLRYNLNSDGVFYAYKQAESSSGVLSSTGVLWRDDRSTRVDWAANPNAGQTFSEVYLEQMPAGVLTSQGLV
ncbi:hypothetical protein CXF72_02440, partial [Psychromonas sp. MB-3u-54]|uniref:hypothetical protein n=1 Tax=Psychromonas sp. MB-3u-54 TaxID=2058319 RepID=UPI000CAE2132